jgi:hypothetical protein
MEIKSVLNPKVIYKSQDQFSRAIGTTLFPLKKELDFMETVMYSLRYLSVE